MSGRGKLPAVALALLLAVLIALAPGLALARAGGSTSFGSRGGRSYFAPPSTPTAPYSAQPLERSLTPRQAPGYTTPGYRPYGAGRSPFVSGLLGGFVGAGLAGLLFGHGLFGGITGFGSFFGLLIQIGLIVLLLRWLLRRWRAPATAPGGGLFAPSAAPAGPAAGAPVTISPADYRAFEATLQQVQAAWSAQDLNGLRAVATPEMVSVFSEQLAEQASRGVRNIVRDVRLERGDLAESWSEGTREYATVAMRFSMTDVTVDSAGRVVDGSADERVTATEIWTFLRAPGGRWLLSAIQQAR